METETEGRSRSWLCSSSWVVADYYLLIGAVPVLVDALEGVGAVLVVLVLCLNTRR